MKKTIFLLMAAAAICGTAQATILRVNNTAGAGAPYTTFKDAHDAAEAGDTIMLDGSSVTYSNTNNSITISKRLVIIGPGYWRTTNGIVEEGGNNATFASSVTLEKGATGTIIRGITFTTGGLNSAALKIYADDVVINRCNIGEEIQLGAGTTGAIIHQCFITTGIYGNSGTKPTNTQVSNNIFTKQIVQNAGIITYLDQAKILNNTFVSGQNNAENYNWERNLTGCTIENNILYKVGNLSSCTYLNNYIQKDEGGLIYKDTSTDLTIKNQELDATVKAAIAGKGAFEGDDPYVISGIPAGPVIEGITVPASVEQGNTLNVTIKLGVQK